MTSTSIERRLQIFSVQLLENLISLFLVNLYGLLILMLLAGSAATWTDLIRGRRTGDPIVARRFRSLAAPVPKIIAAMVLAYLALNAFLIFSPASPSEPRTEFSVESTMQLVRASIVEGAIAIGLFGMMLALSVKQPSELIRLGFRTDHFKEQTLDGFRGFLLALLPVLFLLIATFPIRSVETTHPFLRLVDEQGARPEFLLVAFAAVVIAPLKEELIFRVGLQSWLTSVVGVPAGIGLTALIFAAIHGFPDAIPLLPLALILGIVYHFRRSFWSVVVIHALFNALNLSAVWIQNHAEKLVAVSLPG